MSAGWCRSSPGGWGRKTANRRSGHSFTGGVLVAGGAFYFRVVNTVRSDQFLKYLTAVLTFIFE